MVFKHLCVLVLWTKAAAALEGFILNPFNAEAKYFHPKHNDAKIFEDHLNPVMLVFIRL